MKYVLVDFMHLAHRCIAVEPLRATVKIDGVLQEIETTIPFNTAKWITKYGKDEKGYKVNLGVFFEGGNDYRKNYFRQGDQEGEYKEGRKIYYPLRVGTDYTKMLLKDAEMSIYSARGFEADDSIYTIVEAIKAQDPDYDISVITNDSDLLPLVEDRVSVYMRGTMQHAEEGYPEHRLYYQVTPETWEDYLLTTSQYKKYGVPYNAIILYKLIRGDKADNIIGACKGFGPVKLSKLFREMESDNVDFPNIFRYNNEFDVMEETLLNYFTQEEVDTMRFIYNGMRLRLICDRQDLTKVTLPGVIDIQKLGKAGEKFRIYDFYRL